MEPGSRFEKARLYTVGKDTVADHGWLDLQRILPIGRSSFGIFEREALCNTTMIYASRHQPIPQSRRPAYPAVRAAGGDENTKGPGDGRTTTGVVVKPRPKVKKPSMYKVLMLNDDYTPMEIGRAHV